MTDESSPRRARPDYWGECPWCGHTLLTADHYCPSCGHQRDYSEWIG